MNNGIYSALSGLMARTQDFEIVSNNLANVSSPGYRAQRSFFETLETGMQILDSALGGDVKVLPGEVAFKLHDTYGFPLDLSADVCRERGLTVDEAGFAAAMEKQKSQARAAGKFKMDKALDYSGAGNRFVGYEQLRADAQVLALYVEGTPTQALQAGQSGVVVLDTTPFYAESGGQVGDQGLIHNLFNLPQTPSGQLNLTRLTRRRRAALADGYAPRRQPRTTNRGVNFGRR